ncbi:MAG: thrombospondin, partial [Myxococcota bacterium]
VDNCPSMGNPDQIDDDRDQVGDACDDRYCFVVMGDQENCLDPTDPFQVYVPSVEMDEGDEVRLRLFANHANQAMRYTWSVVSAPERSHATVTAAVGGANLSTPFEYRYAADNVAMFTPDRPGTYTIRVVAELAFEDGVTGQTQAVSEYTTVLVANPVERTGCSTTSTRPFLWTLLPATALLLLRRRRD